MDTSEHRWAAAGKIGAVLVAAATLVLTVIQIGQAIGGPDLVGVVEAVNHVPAPQFREKLVGGFERKQLIKIIEEKEKDNADPGQIVAHLKSLAAGAISENERKLLSLDVTLNSTAWRVLIMNNSDQPAERVRLVVPGSGKADILDCDCGTPDLETPPTDWKNQIDVGSLTPHGKAQLLVWPDRSLVRVRSTENIGLLYAGGSGTVREWQKFAGWDSELVTWFLGQSALLRYGSALLGAGLIVLGMAFLYRRGHIVLRPSATGPRAPRTRAA